MIFEVHNYNAIISYELHRLLSDSRQIPITASRVAGRTAAATVGGCPLDRASSHRGN